MKLRNIPLQHCPLCSAENIQFILTSSDFDTNSGDYAINQCKNCKIYFTNPQVDIRDIAQLYTERVSGEFLPKSSSFIEKLRNWQATVSVKTFFKQITTTENTILDIGCGDGLYSVALAQHPLCKKITSVDFHESPPLRISNSNKNNLTYQRFDLLFQDKTTYDIIFCRHVLEHTVAPISFLYDLNPLLKENGKIFIEVPNFECIWRKFFMRYYVNLYVPRHFFHFNQETLKNVIESAGFEIEKTFSAHLPSLGWSIRNKLQLLPLRKIGVLELALFPLEIAVNILWGQATCIGLIIKKSSKTSNSQVN